MSATPFSKLAPAAYTPVGSEVFRGLTARPKTLSPWLFYDAEGSRWFEEITELPEYYLTRTERSILLAHAEEILKLAARDRQLTIIELGAGTATKTGLLLQAAAKQQGSVTYYPIDVSHTALDEAKSRIESEIPGVLVQPRVADYTEGLGQITPDGSVSGRGPRLVLYIGSSIGNFDPAEALAVLRGVRSQLSPGDSLLLGVDLVKDLRPLLAAYNDAAGVTAAFNKNVLTRINRELDADFNLDLFRHQAIWNPLHSRVEMHLESLVAHEVSIEALDLHVRFARGETIHTENSYKFTHERVDQLVKQAGFTLRQTWMDDKRWFGVHLAEAG